MNSPGDRVAVIGDVGGHFTPLTTVLTSLGVEFAPEVLSNEGSGPPAWTSSEVEWPDDLQVIQVGDLVHRGPDSAGVVGLVDHLLDRGVWTQIVGNHEQFYVDRPVFHWTESTDDDARSRLREWWADGRLCPAAQVSSAEHGTWLITHAGLTAGFWQHGLGATSTVAATVRSLADAAADGALWHPGTMLTGIEDDSAGPVWAAAGTEVYPSWPRTGLDLPFNQAHGHSSAFDWNLDRWSAETWIRHRITLDPARRHAAFTLGRHRIVGIDPGHLAEAAPTFAALVIPAAEVG